MGAHHARVLSQSPGVALDVVIDRDSRRPAPVASPGAARHGIDHDLALGCDAAIVATNAETHAEVAATLLGAGIPLLIEKPLSPLLGEARLIVETSRRLGVPVSCGFVERFNPVVRTAERLMHEDFGPALHLVGIRHSPQDAAGGRSAVPVAIPGSEHSGQLTALDAAGYRVQTVMHLPLVREAREPLALQLAHFLALVRGEADPDLERASLLAPHEAVAVLQDHAIGGL